MEEYKIVNQNLALEMEEYKKKEVETTRLKDEVTRERAGLVERNVGGCFYDILCRYGIQNFLFISRFS